MDLAIVCCLSFSAGRVRSNCCYVGLLFCARAESNRLLVGDPFGATMENEGMSTAKRAVFRTTGRRILD